MGKLAPGRTAILVSLAIAAIAIVILLAMGRPPICECGYIKLWHGQINDTGNSQHIADWYTPSHIIHGMIFYALVWWLFVRRGFGGAGAPMRWGLPLAVLLESAWEVAENTPLVIDRFRSVTANFGYSGDSVLNSAADIGWMSFGFWLALRLPVKTDHGARPARRTRGRLRRARQSDAQHHNAAVSDRCDCGVAGGGWGGVAGRAPLRAMTEISGL